MEIKKLDWIRIHRAFEANTPFGTYTIYGNANRRSTLLFRSETVGNKFYNYIEAKNAAQKDFEERVN